MTKETLLSGYKTLAVIFLNTVLLLLPLYGLYRGASWIFTPPPPEATRGVDLGLHGNAIYRKYSINPAPAYPDLSPAQVDEMLESIWRNRELVYTPFVNFKERIFTSTYVNVNEFGIRKTVEDLPWPPGPGPNVFVFGGSTVFGYGVADHHTIPANMARISGAHVYNLGCAYYYSSQERALFDMLLTRGIVPDQAIFIDGLNDLFGGEDVPALSERFCKLLGTQRISKIPSNEPIWKRAIDIYVRNKRLIEGSAAQFGVKVTFIWQPTRAYKFDTGLDLFKGIKFPARQSVKEGYRVMEELYRTGQMGENFWWCADMHNGVKWPYIDEVHYSPEMCRVFAEAIVKKILSTP